MDGPLIHTPNMSPMHPISLEEDSKEEDTDTVAVENLRRTRGNVAAIVASADELRKGVAGVDSRLSLSLETLEAASDAVNPLQTQSIAARALHSRINRAVAPALSVLHSFSLVESLQRRLVALSSKPTTNRTNLPSLLKYVDCVDRLTVAVATVTEECQPAVLKLQEAVEFLSRTKATDQLRLHRLRETLAAIKALYETEVDALRYEGVLDEALLRLQDDYEGILLQIKHREIGGGGGDAEDEVEAEGWDDGSLGTDLEVEVLGRISETLASNDCMDICIDIYVKARYRRAAKALMRLNPTYLKTYAPEDVDRMEWEALESAITLWIEHFQLAVKVVFVAEKNLCGQALSGIMGGAVWPECFVKIADKIMAVFFRFGEGVARSSKEPQKLFKLLDMYDAMDRMRGEFLLVFDGEPSADICARFRELQKLLVDTTSKVFWEFGLQIEGHQDGAPPPADGSVPNIVRYAVNYLKCLAATGYGATMEHVLRTEQAWKKSGSLSRTDPNESLLREAVSNAMEALQRNVEMKRSRYKDAVASHILAVNAYWYMYMRTKGSELAKLVGEETMKKKYKMAAEEAAYSYQAQAWGPLVKLLEREEPSPRTANGRRDALEIMARGKMEAFARELEESLRRHRSSYSVPDADLREQMKGAVVKMVMPAYTGFLHAYSGATLGRSLLAPESVKELLGRLFEGGEGIARGRARRVEVEGGTLSTRRESKSRGEEDEEELELELELEDRNVGEGKRRANNIKRREYKHQVEEEREEEEEEEEEDNSGDEGRGNSRKSSFRSTGRFSHHHMDEEDDNSEETRGTLRGGLRGRRSEVIEVEKSRRRVFRSQVDGKLDENRRPILDDRRTSFERRRTKYEGEEESVGRDYGAVRGERERRRTKTENKTSSTFRDRKVTRQIENDEEEDESDGRSSKGASGEGDERRRRVVAERSRPNFGRRHFFRNQVGDEGEEEGINEIGDGRVRKEGVRIESVEGKKTSFGRREIRGLVVEGLINRDESERTIGEAKGKGRERRGMVEGEKINLRREFRSREDNVRKEIGEGGDKVRGDKGGLEEGHAYIRRREFTRKLDEEEEQNTAAAMVRRGDRRTSTVESGNSKYTRREF